MLDILSAPVFPVVAERAGQLQVTSPRQGSTDRTMALFLAALSGLSLIRISSPVLKLVHSYYFCHVVLLFDRVPGDGG